MKTKKHSALVLTIILLEFFIRPFFAHAAESDLVISEIAAYEASDYEWLEIYNKGSEPIDLTNWKFFEDQTNHRLSAEQNDLIIDPGEYAIIADVAVNFKQAHPDFTGTIIDSSWTTLREDGEEIALKNSADEIIESFTYLPCPNTSLQRLDLNSNDYTATNWQVHETGNSAGIANQFPNQNPPPDDPPPDNPPPDNPPPDDPLPEPEPIIPIAHPKIISAGTLVINEFVSDPADGEVEWVELYNKNVFDIDLTGWKIIDGSGAETELSGIIGSNFDNKFFVIESPKGKLNNSGDVIILKNQQNNPIDTVYYGNWNSGFIEENAPTAKDPYSTARIFDGGQTFKNSADFVVTQTPTKGEPNLITLTEEAKKEATAEINANEIKTKIETKIIISEIYPNPSGSDLEFEWLELKNINETEIDLLGWQIKDNSKKTYKISALDFPTTIIKPGQFFILPRSITGLALNNDQDTIKLLSPEDKTIQTIKYNEDETVPENTAYAVDIEGNWFWSTTPTENQANLITKLNHAPEIDFTCPKTAEVSEIITCDASDSYDLEDDKLIFTWLIEEQTYQSVIAQHQFKIKGTYTITLLITDGQLEVKEVQKIKINGPEPETKTPATKTTATVKKTTVKKTTTTKKTTTAKKTAVITGTLEEIKNLPLNTKVKTTGIVSVLPITFGKTIMYVAGSGLQVYMSKASWPELKLGDQVELNGILSQSLGEKRLKLAAQPDIKVIASQAPPEPKIITIAEIKPELVGYLIKISGQLIEKNGAKFYLRDNTGETLVYIKTNTKITKTNFLEGDQLKITGILSQNNEQLQVLPRSNEDITKIIVSAPAEQSTIPANQTSNDIMKYLVAGGIFAMVGLVTALVINKKQK